MRKRLSPLAVAVAVALSGGCATPLETDPRYAVEGAAADVTLEGRYAPGNTQRADDPVVIDPAGRILSTLVQRPQNPVDVGFSTAVDIATLMQVVADQFDWTVRFTSDVDSTAAVQVRMSNVEFTDAFADIAELAGYTVILEHDRRRVTVTNRATWTFRFPPHIARSVKWEYSVGGNPVNTQEEDISESFSADSTISGQHEETIGEALAFLTAAVNAGNDEGQPQAVLTAFPGRGILVVDGDATQLRRAESLIRQLVYDATTRVEINAAIVEVSSRGRDEIGINWVKILNANPDEFKTVGIIGREIAAPSFTSSITKRSLTFVLNALQTQTDLNVVTRPNLLIDNHTPADLVDASIEQYLSSVESTVDENGNVSYSAESDNAISGLKISVLPHVFSPTQVKLHLIPFLGDVPNYQTFDFGVGSSLTLPNQLSKQALLSVTMTSGETLVLAGNKVRSGSRGSSGLPVLKTPITESKWSDDETKEVAILIHVNILPPPHEDVVLERSL